MGEPRRIELMPVGPLAKEKKVEKIRHSIRFHLSLGETTTHTYFLPKIDKNDNFSDFFLTYQGISQHTLTDAD